MVQEDLIDDGHISNYGAGETSEFYLGVIGGLGSWLGCRLRPVSTSYQRRHYVTA